MKRLHMKRRCRTNHSRMTGIGEASIRDRCGAFVAPLVGGGGALCIAALLGGCASSSRMDVAPTSQPVDVTQLTGQVVAAVRSEVSQQLSAHVTATAQGIGYQSDFGIGAAAAVLVALILTLWLSHRREMERIKREKV